MISLSWPYAFLLLPLPYLVYRFWPPVKNTIAALYMPGISRQAFEGNDTAVKNSPKKQIFLLSLMWVLFLAALSGPVKLGDAIKLPVSGRDLLLAVDISPSMEERDMIIHGQAVNRLSATKAVLDDFLNRRQGDRVGLILYGANAFIQAPLTFDLKTVKEFLLESQTGFAGNATAIGDAIGLGIKKLENSPEEHRTMILLSDGENTAGVLNPIEAAKFAKQQHIKIYTIALGHPRSRYPVDERALKTIADITGAQFFRARNPAELESIYAKIDKLEPIDQEAEIFRPKTELFYWPLGFMLLTILVIAFNNRFPSIFSNESIDNV